MFFLHIYIYIYIYGTDGKERVYANLATPSKLGSYLSTRRDLNHGFRRIFVVYTKADKDSLDLMA